MAAKNTNNEMLILVLSRLESLDRNMTALQEEVKLKMRAMEDQVLSLDHRLWGNGQPGTVTKIEDDIKKTNDQHAALSAKVWKVGFLGFVAVMVVCFLTGGGPLGIQSVLTIFGLVAK